MSGHEHDMSCKEAFARLNDFVDRELTEAEMGLVRQHLGECAGCAREFRLEAGMLTCIRERLSKVAVPPELTERILRALSSRPPPTN